ncbi:hypothetical protein NST28_09425 [Paenibacillus sp. FSL R10-2791]|uniref:WD40/YVTN/BNR-like repeat-containing protein n=1 Tax=Paenibacillus TaxID=44249 RepID=UPI00096FB00C|nr:hypothetical protein [Paenibacillus odorifer]OME24853.1 hypothetical protein BSK57_13680 [Paenibacillus odorifer]
MKYLVSILLIAAVIASGCTNTTPIPHPTSNQETSPSPNPNPNTNLNADTDSSDNRREDTVFLNKNIGWKVVYHFQGMSREDMELYATSDGGETWKEMGDSLQAGSTLPSGVKSGLTFVNEKEGWITTNAPWEGKVGLYKTMDGGVTWSEQTVTVPGELVNSQIYAYPPLFLTKDQGILITRPVEKEHTLLFITIDGGQHWKSFLDDHMDQYVGIAWTLSESMATVKYAEKTWTLSMQNYGKWSL